MPTTERLAAALADRAVGSEAGDTAQDRIVIVQDFAAELRAKVR